MRVGDLKRGLLLRCADGWGAYVVADKILKMLPAALVPDQEAAPGPGTNGIMMFLGVRKSPPMTILPARMVRKPSRWYEVLHDSNVWCISGYEFKHIESIDSEVSKHV